jgi:hypothetical protein
MHRLLELKLQTRAVNSAPTWRFLVCVCVLYHHYRSHVSLWPDVSTRPHLSIYFFLHHEETHFSSSSSRYQISINPLRTECPYNNIYKFISYLTWNTLRLRYKAQSSNGREC